MNYLISQRDGKNSQKVTLENVDILVWEVADKSFCRKMEFCFV